MFELYRKVEKSIEYPRGEQKIILGENPFESGPCLLCISAQDIVPKSIFGLTKAGARMARIRVNGDVGARIPIGEVPISFLSIKPDEQNYTEEDRVAGFVEQYIRPMIINENNEKLSKEDAMKKIRNINIMSNCNGTERALSIIKGTERTLMNLGYSEAEIQEMLSQIALLSFQTDIDLSDCRASVVDFHNLNDTEVFVNSDNIAPQMVERNTNSKNRETVDRASNGRIEILISGEDSHKVKDYMEEGKAMPVIVHTIVSEVLGNSVENSRGNSKFIPLSIEDLLRKAEGIIQRIENGEAKESLIEELDSKLTYGQGITRLSNREIAIIEEKERLAKTYDMTQGSLDTEKKYRARLENDKNNMKAEALRSCSEPTYLKILEAYGWQLSPEQKQKTEEPSDKERLGKQEQKISKLQSMLNRTLQFADDVRNSVFGKIFFRKSIKELPESDMPEEER